MCEARSLSSLLADRGDGLDDTKGSDGPVVAGQQVYWAERALLPTGWARDVRLTLSADGLLAAVEPGTASNDAQRLAGPVLPGMPNLHSHAFQRAMAGLAERRAGAHEDFWSWRQAMYRFLTRIGPPEVHAIAAQLYVEMLKSGYTQVAEFHYVHHAPDGRPYTNPAELALQVARAADRAGIGLTHLPVLYRFGGFGEQPATEDQRRFINELQDYLRIFDELVRHAHTQSNLRAKLRIGAALHSLRAVSPPLLTALCEAVAERDPAAPMHIHVAEQRKEVDACRAWCRARPVAWLLDHAPVDARWCLVHATHMAEAETRHLAATGAVAGLCPTTEANLGDGLFALPLYQASGGRWGIGSDSHITVDPLQELRLLEYGQRLELRRRSVAATEHRPSTGAALFTAALAGGAQACGGEIAALAPGHRADLVVLEADHPALFDKQDDALLDAAIFAASSTPVRDVMVGGTWVVEDRRHFDEDAVFDAYRAAMTALLRG